MRRTLRSLWSLVLLVLAAAGATRAQTVKQPEPGKSPGPDLTRTPTLYVVPYAHLDTEWRWDYPTTIGEYLPRTMRDNFALFEKYPHYVFNFSGANRYRMMKEYYPADFARVKQYVAAGRWFPSGSSMEENDVNNPSAESILRQVLYGTRWFRAEFGRTSAEYMLPDCFGFPASLPSILAHAGLKGFSTQKLTWHGSAPVGGPGSPQETPTGVPFNVGYWVGLDGRGVVAALNAQDYSGDVTYDLSKTPAPSPPPASTPVDWPKRIDTNGHNGLLTDFEYYGTGDVGGAPREWSIKIMEGIVTRGTTTLPLPGQRSGEGAPVPKMSDPVPVGDGPVHVLQTTAERMFLDVRPEWLSRLPHYTGDLELIEHSAGSLTSEAYMKRWNRQNETLADAAERASVAAAWLGARPYPQKRLNDAWTLVMGGQFHDLIPGTSEPKAYEYAWNDEVLALSQFAGVLTSAVGAVAAGLDTRAQGTPVVVYNPLNLPRTDVVEARLPSVPAAVRVFGPDGNEVPAQVSNGKVVFVARVPSVGFSVYDVRPADTPAVSAILKATEASLENERYTIRLDNAGDLASIFDRKVGRELLSAPARLALTTDKPSQWPAWNIDWNDAQQPPRAFVAGPARVRVVESGPARVALEVTRDAEGSHYVQTIRLGAGDAGNRVEIATALDWKTSQANLKASFPFTVSNPKATYNWDIGTIQRGNDDPKKFEVASHQWVDLTDSAGGYGVTLLTGAKNASDKPDDHTLRLTLVRTPGISEGWEEYGDQSTQDWGHHEFVYGIAAHEGDWRAEHTQWQALRLDQPLVAFVSDKHDGRLGHELSLLRVSAANVRALALKQAESGDGFVVRLVETEDSARQGVRTVLAGPIVYARELDGQERPIAPQGRMYVRDGALFADFTPYQPRTFLVRLAPAPWRVSAPASRPVALSYDVAVASNDGDSLRTGAGFDGSGNALPAEMLPAILDHAGVRFQLAPAGTGKMNALAARGQTLSLPAGDFDHVYVLAAAARSDRAATFRPGDHPVQVTVQQWGGFVGQWDDRQWQIVEQPVPPEPAPDDSSRAARRAREVRAQVAREGPIKRPEFTGLTPGFVKPGEVAWFASHHHRPDGTNAPYEYAYLYAIPLELPAGAHTLTLPDDPDIRVLAVTAARTGPTVHAAQPLFDTLEHTGERSASR